MCIQPRAVIEVTEGRPRAERSPIFEEGVLHAVDRNLFAVYGRLSLQSEDLEQLSVKYCWLKPYINFMYRQCSYYSQIITHDACLDSGLLWYFHAVL